MGTTSRLPIVSPPLRRMSGTVFTFGQLPGNPLMAPLLVLGFSEDDSFGGLTAFARDHVSESDRREQLRVLFNYRNDYKTFDHLEKKAPFLQWVSNRWGVSSRPHHVLSAAGWAERNEARTGDNPRR